MDETRLIYTTWPNAEAAANAARTLVEERLAACANIVPGALSVHWWEGTVEATPEAVVIFKTTRIQAARLRTRITELHAYDLPAIVALDVDANASSGPFLDWIASQTRQTKEKA